MGNSLGVNVIEEYDDDYGGGPIIVVPSEGGDVFDSWGCGMARVSRAFRVCLYVCVCNRHTLLPQKRRAVSLWKRTRKPRR